MKTYYISRQRWNWGPLSEARFREMIKQRWFRHGDQIRVGDDGPWLPAEVMVAPHYFGDDPEPNSDDDSLSHAARMRGESNADDNASQAHSDTTAAPAWFQRRRDIERGRPEIPDEPASSDLDDDDLDDSARAGGSPANNSPADSSATKPQRRPTIPSALRFETAEFELPAGYIPALPSEEIEPRFQSPPDRERHRQPSSSETRSDIRVIPADEFEESEERNQGNRRTERQRRSADPPDEADSSRPLSAEHTAQREARRRLKQSSKTDSGSKDNSQEAVEKAVPLQSHYELAIDPDQLQPPPPKPSSRPTPLIDDAFDAPDDEQSEKQIQWEIDHGPAPVDVDFTTAAKLASHDPRVSYAELPTTSAITPPLSPEERTLRLMATSGAFQDSLSRLGLSIGIQACFIAAVVNGFLFCAFQRLFLLSVEVFIPFGQGTGETLRDDKLALCGIAWFITIALPFLPLSYLISVSGQLLAYLGSLGAGMVLAFGFLHATQTTGTVCMIALITLPSVAVSIFAIPLAKLSTDPAIQKCAIGTSLLSIVTAIATGVASPNFGIRNQIAAFPPELFVESPIGYAVLTAYAAALIPIYLLIRKLAISFCDEATQEMVNQHALFHGLLSFGSLATLCFVHLEGVRGWLAIPTLMASLTMTVAVGFNLWSLATHFLPVLDRIRRDD